MSININANGGGAGYTSAPTLKLSGCSTQPTATVQIGTLYCECHGNGTRYRLHQRPAGSVHQESAELTIHTDT